MAKEVFADGEPVDPQKLRSLQEQITKLEGTAGAAFNLISTTVGGSTKEIAFHCQSNVVPIKGVTHTKNGTVSTGIYWDSNVYEKPATISIPMLSSANKNIYNIVVQSGSEFAPILNVYWEDSSGKKAAMPETILHVISVARKKSTS
jgi:hypothetical protein